MNTIQLTQAEALKLYDEASEQGKKLLNEKLGPLKLRIEDRINSVEDACREVGRSIDEVIPFKNPANDFQDFLNAVAEMAVICEAFNEGKVPDWKNEDQHKWIPWWWMNRSSGSGLWFDDAFCDCSSATVASRLHLLNQNHVKIVAERFFSIHERMMTQKLR